MLSDRERHEFEEIVRNLLADGRGGTAEEPTSTAVTPSPNVRPKANRRLVAWAERRFLHRLEASELRWLG